MKAKIKINASGNVYDTDIDELGMAWFAVGDTGYLHAWRFEYEILEELTGYETNNTEMVSVVVSDCSETTW